MHELDGPTDEELNYIDEILEKYQTDDSLLDCAELEGFLTAVISGPKMLHPSDWLPEIWGQGGMPDWQQDEMERFFAIATRILNTLVSIFMEAPKQFEPLAYEMPEEEQVIPATNLEWCLGYLRGAGMHGAEWEEMPEDLLEKYQALAMLALQPVMEESERFSDEEIKALDAEIGNIALAIHQYWLQQRMDDDLEGFENPANVTPFVRDNPKVGRNDPCPCGSGKKYKKCCGLN